MIAIGIVLNLVGLGIFCWLLFTLAVYALPFFVGATTGVFAYHSGAGPLGAIAVGLLAGARSCASPLRCCSQRQLLSRDSSRRTVLPRSRRPRRHGRTSLLSSARPSSAQLPGYDSPMPRSTAGHRERIETQVGPTV